MIPNNNTGTGANDGNCPLYPGVFMSDPVQGEHTYRTVDMTRRTGSSRATAGTTCTTSAPLFPFGHGLSYTQFSYSHLNVDPAADGGVDVTSTSSNTGSTTGAEVPQVYVGAPNDPPAGVSFAVRALAQFQRITLAPGQSQRVKVHVGLRRFTYWSTTDHRWIVAGGPRTVFVGASSRDMKLQRAVNIAAPVLGSQAKGSEVDNDVAGQAEAFRNVAPIDGTLDHASVFVDRKSAAKDLIVGLYADAGGHPGPLLARGDLESPSGNDWNTVPLPTTTISAGQPYWIALLGTGGTLRFRDECCGAKGSQPSESNALKKLTDLPATWSTGTVYRTTGRRLRTRRSTRACRERRKANGGRAPVIAPSRRLVCREKSWGARRAAPNYEPPKTELERTRSEVADDTLIDRNERERTRAARRAPRPSPAGLRHCARSAVARTCRSLRGYR